MFENSKVGDICYIQDRYHRLSKTKMKRIGKNFVECDDGLKYRIEDGQKKGSDCWNYIYLLPQTKELDDEYNKLQLFYKIKTEYDNLNLYDLKDRNIEELNEIYVLILDLSKKIKG